MRKSHPRVLEIPAYAGMAGKLADTTLMTGIAGKDNQLAAAAGQLEQPLPVWHAGAAGTAGDAGLSGLSGLLSPPFETLA